MLDVDVNHEFDNYQTLSALLLENADMQAIYRFLEAGGQLIDDEGFPAIESAYFAYLHQQNEFTKARFSLFKPLIAACLSNSDNEHWLQNLVLNIKEERQQEITQLLGTEEALTSFYDRIDSNEGSAISADVRCIGLIVYPEFSLDITLDVKTIDPWVLPPFVRKLWIMQARDGCLWFEIENSLGQCFSFEITDLQQKGCVSVLSFSEFILQHLDNIASRVSALIHRNHQALNCLGKSYIPALLALIKHGGVLVKEDNGRHLKQLLARPFEREFDSLEHFYYQVSEQACEKPNYVVEVTESKVDLIRFNEPNCSYQAVVSYDFNSEPARQQAYALVVSHLWGLASTL